MGVEPVQNLQMGHFEAQGQQQQQQLFNGFKSLLRPSAVGDEVRPAVVIPIPTVGSQPGLEGCGQVHVDF